MKAVDGLKVSQRAKDELNHQLKVALNNLGPNLNFSRDQFGEYMEETTQRPKAEINAYAQHMLERYGTVAKSLGYGDTPVRVLEGQHEEASSSKTSSA
jgi:hypothetical protein